MRPIAETFRHPVLAGLLLAGLMAAPALAQDRDPIGDLLNGDGPVSTAPAPAEVSPTPVTPAPTPATPPAPPRVGPDPHRDPEDPAAAAQRHHRLPAGVPGRTPGGGRRADA